MSAVTPAATLRPPIPGLSTRPFRAGDGAALAAFFNAMDAADDVPWRSSAEEMENWMGRTRPSYDPARDALLVEVDGSLIGFRSVDWVDTTDGLREYRLGGGVHPDWRRRGIGRWLLRDGEEHARAIDAAEPPGRPRAYGVWAPDVRAVTIALLTHEGYAPVRYFFEMVRADLEAIELTPLPDGLELRPVGPESYRRLWDADTEAFADHWGGHDTSEASFQAWIHDPRFNPSLFVVAWDGDEIAGGVINEINEAENAAFHRRRGWLASVFVRRPWRRRGLARAVVLQSLALLKERGLTSAGLGVDADNPNAALRLYEQTGFVTEMHSAAYRKPMEAG